MEFSAPFLSKLRAIENCLIGNIILSNYEELSGVFDYVNIGSRADLVSFLPNSNNSDEEWTQGRNEIKIGRFVKKILELVNEEALIVLTITDKELEDFVNKYKTTSTEDEFRIVDGEDIRTWYHEEMYMDGDGSLNESCMSGEEEQRFLNIYVNNDKVRLLTLVNKNNRLVGRALLWTLDESPSPTNIFMDRIYVCEEYLYEVFKQKADEEGWMYKVAQSNDMYRAQQFNHAGKKYTGPIGLKLSKFKYNKYPYLDSLPFFDKETGVIRNRGFIDAIVLRSVEGRGNDKCCCCSGSFEFDCDRCSDRPPLPVGQSYGTCPYCSGTGKRRCNECNFD